MKKILFIVVAIIMAACSTVKEVENNDVTYGQSMKNSFEAVFSLSQFDSICKADTLPSNLDKWQKLQYRDYETKVGTEEFLFIKKLGNGEKIYRLEKIDDNFKITKRIIK